MGSISFLLPSPMPAAADAMLRSACFSAGYDQAPVPTALEILDDRLVATWELGESRYLSIPWHVGRSGVQVTTTATVRESPQPYRLLVELARGKLHQVRTQAAEWVAMGLRTPPGFDDALAGVGRLFGAVLCATPEIADVAARDVLEQSYLLGDTLAREFVAQLLDTRHMEEGLLDTRLAARTTGAPGDEYARSFNAAQLAVRWRDVEPEESRYEWAALDRAVGAAKAAGLPATLGPVIDLAPGMVPEWVAGWKGDFPTLAAFMCDFTERVVERYKADVRRWVVCAGVNHAPGLGLDDDERLRLAFRLCETATGIDPALELVVSVAQPWGDYLADEAQTISPITFPDDLLRTGLKISAVELELRAGTAPRGSRPRDLLEAWRILQLFGGLGLPLEVVLSHPSGGEPDPAVASGEAVWAPGWLAGPSPESQADWGAAIAGLAISCPEVRAVTWDHWSDAEPHLVPHGGLLDSEGRARPLLSRLRTLRSAHIR